jgi:putative heme transporter
VEDVKTHSTRQVVSAVPFGLLVAAVIGLCFIVITMAGFLLLQILNPVSPVLTGIAFALLLTGLLLPLKRAVVRVIPNDHAAAGVTMILFLAALIGIIYVTGAQLVAGFAELRDSVFAALEQIEVWLRQGPLDIGEAGFAEWLEQAQTWLTDNSDTLLSGAVAAGSMIGTFGVALGLALVTAFFFLADGRRIWRWFVSLLPDDIEDRVDHAFSNGFHSVRAYVRTQAIVAAVDALGIGFGALVLGLPLVVPLTIIVFLTAFIPVVGAFASGALVVLIAWFSEGFTTALIMLGIVILVQQVESNLLQPVLMSRAVDLHPWAVIIGVTVGSYIYGIVGALFAVPVMAMVKVVVLSLRHPLPNVGAGPPEGPNWPEVLSNARTIGARALPSRRPLRRFRAEDAGATDPGGPGSAGSAPTDAGGRARGADAADAGG